MKKGTFIILFLAMFMQAGGLVLLFTFQQYDVHSEMQLKLKAKESLFQKITLSSDDFKKCKTNSNEISFKHKMYDIKSINYLGKTVELLVLRDTEEESILNKISELFKNPKKPNQDLPKQIQNLSSLYYFVSINKLEFIFTNTVYKYHYSNVLFKNTIEKSVTIPPPKLS